MSRSFLRSFAPAALLALSACGGPPDEPAVPPAGRAPAGGAATSPSGPGTDAQRSFSGPAKPRPSEPGEKHLKNIRQLTFAGENAEAYWSFAGDVLAFQSTRPPYAADQIFLLSPKGGEPTLVSTGLGRTTCAYFLPGDQRLLFASTHLAGRDPPKPPDRSHGYAWGIFEYEIFTVGVDGKDLRRLTNSPGYEI